MLVENPHVRRDGPRFLKDLTRREIRDEVAAQTSREQTDFKRRSASPLLNHEFILGCAGDQQDGDARLFIALNQGRLVLDHSSQRWFFYDGQSWREDRLDKSTASLADVVEFYKKEVQTVARVRAKASQDRDPAGGRSAERKEALLVKKISRIQTKNWKRDVLVLAAAGERSLGITGEEWDQDPWQLGVLNGVVDLRTGRLRDGRPEDFIKTAAATAWAGIDAPCPHWEKFIAEIFLEDMELIAYVQRLLGYGLTGLTVEHILPFFWGEGRNGKGTLLEIVNKVLGPLSGPVESEMLLKQRFSKTSGGPTADIMALRGRRLAWASETDEGRQLDAGRVKWLVGGDTLVGRDLYGRRQVSFPPSHLLILLTNKKPHAPADDLALWARIHVVKFGAQFVDDPVRENQRKRNPYLSKELESESSGILAWLVRGCLDWQKRGGLVPPKSVLAATESYRDAEDLLGAFINDCCFDRPGGKTKANEFYQAYRQWCQDNGHKSASNSIFKEKMSPRFSWSRGNTGAFYNGVELARNTDGGTGG